MAFCVQRAKDVLFCAVNMAERSLWIASFVGLSREMAEERRAMRGDARNDDDDDGDDDDDDVDDDVDEEEALLSIKMANYLANKRQSSDTKRESCWAKKPANSVSVSPPAEGD